MSTHPNRIDAKFESLGRDKKKAFIAFLTAGYPSLSETGKLVLSLEKAGADIVELGVPFSDPLADGPVIQESSRQALLKGVTLRKIIALVKQLRRRTTIPLCLMTYYNPLFSYGEKKFARDAADAGVDGVIVPDLPPEEAVNLRKECSLRGVHTIFFVSPTTAKERMRRIARLSGGFIYYLSVTGVTGVHASLPKEAVRQVRLLRGFTRKPVCMGFGISTPEQVRGVCRAADGAIVGSAIVDCIRAVAAGKKGGAARGLEIFVSRLSREAHRV